VFQRLLSKTWEERLRVLCSLSLFETESLLKCSEYFASQRLQKTFSETPLKSLREVSEVSSCVSHRVFATHTKQVSLESWREVPEVSSLGVVYVNTGLFLCESRSLLLWIYVSFCLFFERSLRRLFVCVSQSLWDCDLLEFCMWMQVSFCANIRLFWSLWDTQITVLTESPKDHSVCLTESVRLSHTVFATHTKQVFYEYRSLLVCIQVSLCLFFDCLTESVRLSHRDPVRQSRSKSSMNLFAKEPYKRDDILQKRPII